MQTQNVEVPEFDNPIAAEFDNPIVVESGDKSSDLIAFQINILEGRDDPMRSHMVVRHTDHPTPLLTDVDD